MKPWLTLLALLGPAPLLAGQPLALHPDNPHYFLFGGKPTILITSGEHYGAVLNLDFDFAKYLDTLARDHLNLTRTFSGSYVEPAGAFGIARNTLAPPAGRFICPWNRSSQPGYRAGGNKFDLSQWDPAYFARLKQFVTQAASAGVVVEMNLFCPFYDDSQWRISPQNPVNNINQLGPVDRTNVYTLDKNGGLLAFQVSMVRKIVTELNPLDNIYYEICNEPYFGGVTIAWQHHIAERIVETEKDLPKHHLISQNIANGTQKIDRPHPAVSIFNFHYATPPAAVGVNYGLQKVIGDNETGFKGTNDTHYRMEAWQFILAGGGLYNNLDYSFTAGYEDGSFIYPAKQPGGGSPALRRQLGILKSFMDGFEFVKMRPDHAALKQPLAAGAKAYVLSEAGRQYAIYLFGGPETTLSLDLPSGHYAVQWLQPVTGRLEDQAIDHRGGRLVLGVPNYSPDLALRITAK